MYKFHIVSHNEGYVGDKADPFGILHEEPPRTASVVWDLEYKWHDRQWMETRAQKRFAAGADFSLRSSPRFLDAGSGGGQPAPDLS